MLQASKQRFAKRFDIRCCHRNLYPGPPPTCTLQPHRYQTFTGLLKLHQLKLLAHLAPRSRLLTWAALVLLISFERSL